MGTVLKNITSYITATPCRGVPARMLALRSVRAGCHADDLAAGTHELFSSVEDAFRMRCGVAYDEGRTYIRCFC